MPLDPRHLRVLLAVHAQGSFTAAADVLGMSQPAVSIAIAQLEDWAGLRVVHRNRKGASLTGAGLLLLRRARAVENLLARAKDEMVGHRDQIEGPLTVAGTPGALLGLLPPILDRLTRSDTAVQVQALEVRDEDILPMLRGRDVDLALCTASRDQPPSDVAQTILASEPFVLLAAADAGLPEAGLTVAEAAACKWILPLAEGATRRQLEAVFLSSGVPIPRTIVRCDALATMKELVRTAGFVALLPASVAVSEVEAGLIRAVPLLGGPPSRQLAVWRLAAEEPMPLASRFIEAARAEASLS